MDESDESHPSAQAAPEVEDQKRGMIDLPQRYDRYEPLAEIIAMIILAIATLATAWSGYQSAGWRAIQAADYSRASARRIQSGQASTAAGQLRQIDIGLFTNWINAYAAGDQRLAGFYQSRFRAEFQPAFKAWLASDPWKNPEAPSSPFAMPQYQLAKDAEAAALDKQAQAQFEAGEAASENADRYVLNTVVLASVLFLAGLASRIKAFRVRAGVVIFAVLILAWAIYSIIILPIQ